MGESSVPAAAACFLLYALQLGVSYFLMPPLHLARPVVTKYTGRFTFLTHQTNCLCTAFFFACLLDALDLVNAHGLMVHAFPLVFALSTFLTIAYYALDHFDPANRARRDEWEAKGWPHFTLACHLQHAFALPVALLHLATLSPETASEIRHYGVSDLSHVMAYSALYLVYMMILRGLTGEFVYPIFDPITAKHGLAGVLVFGLALTGFVAALGYAGVFMA